MADVICPNCNERYHETTDKYNPSIPPNGSMFRLKDFYRQNGWSSFVEDESTIGDNLHCPGCQGTYTEGNPARVRVDQEQYAAEKQGEKTPCPHCGEMFKPSGLHFHVKAKHSDI